MPNDSQTNKNSPNKPQTGGRAPRNMANLENRGKAEKEVGILPNHSGAGVEPGRCVHKWPGSPGASNGSRSIKAVRRVADTALIHPQGATAPTAMGDGIYTVSTRVDGGSMGGGPTKGPTQRVHSPSYIQVAKRGNVERAVAGGHGIN